MSLHGIPYQRSECFNPRECTPACPGEDHAFFETTSPMPYMEPYLQSYAAYPYLYIYQEQSSSSAYYPPVPSYNTGAAAMQTQYSSPSTSPIDTTMVPYGEMYNIPPQHPSHPGNHQICEWMGCNVPLDDLSHAGIRRHFREYHVQARGSTLRCSWGQNCRSEEMLFDNIAKHIAECHLKSMKKECPTCGNSFARNDTLKRHLNAGCPGLVRQ